MRAILTRRPDLEDELHDLHWRGAQRRTEDGKASLERVGTLLAQVAQVAPDAAAQRAADHEALERKLAALRKRNGF